MKKKVEDILTAEDISLEKIQQEVELNHKDIIAAKEIYSYLQIPKHAISDSDKRKLKSKIERSVKEYNYKANSRRWLAIASVFVFALLGGVNLYQSKHSSAIINFAKGIKENKNDSITRLVLNTGDEIRIKTTESEIKYDKKGESINIDSGRRILQKVEPLETSYNTVFVPYGKRTQITLSEGTKVWLNSGSKLVYPAVFASNTREVYIDGEGIFEVTKNPDKPFIVKSDGFDIQVLGTVFNVSAYSDDKCSYAVLKEGTIKLKEKSKTFAKSETHMLAPGDMAILDLDLENITLKKVDPSNYLSWREGYYVFKSEQLGSIVKKISRYYNIELILENRNLVYDTFSGSLDLKSNPEDVLNIISETTSLKYRKEGTERIIIY